MFLKTVSELCEKFSRTANNNNNGVNNTATSAPASHANSSPSIGGLHDPEPELDAVWVTFVSELASTTSERLQAVEALKSSALKHLTRVAKSDMAEQLSRMSTAKVKNLHIP